MENAKGSEAPEGAAQEPRLSQGAVISAASLPGGSAAPTSIAGSSTSAQAASDAHAAEQAARAADAHYSRGEFPAALGHYAAAVRLAPRHGPFHFRLGCCAWDVGQRGQALHHLFEAVRLDAADAAAHEALGQMLMESGRNEQSLHHSALAVQLAPKDAHYAVSRAMVLETNRQSSEAWEIVDRLMKEGFSSPRLALLMSRMGKSQQREGEALAMVERELAAGPRRRIDEISLNFAAAAVLDRAGRYDEAFARARKANGLVGATYDAAAVERSIDATINYFTRRKARSLPRAMTNDERPVFIVGMPRSGTSLVEQIVATHPQVYGAGELEAIFQVAGQISSRLGGAGFPQVLNRISSSMADEFAASYLQALSMLAPAARRITDKLPLNFLRLGLISILFPHARVIHCRRDPRDTCLSCFMTHFSGGNEFSYHLQSCGHFYRHYERLMAHWKTVLEIPILEIDYERLVEDLEAQSRRMMEFLRLKWDAACLRFHENRRYVPTASNAQVREPIYRSSLGRWRHYEKHLPPLLAGLGWG